MTKHEVFAELRKRGATRAQVDFSGGNDEGGADSIVLLNGKDEVGSVEASWRNQDKFAEALERPVYDRYGSFAGDFSVSGTVTWDAATGKVTMTYDESEYVHHEDEVA